MVAGTLVRQREHKMTYPMFDHLRIMSEVLTTGAAVLGIGSLFVCFKLLVASVPVNASLASA